MGVRGVNLGSSRAVRCSSPGREPALAERCQSLGLCLRCGEAAAEVTLLHLGLQSYNLHMNCWRWLPALILMDKRWPHGITQRYLDSWLNPLQLELNATCLSQHHLILFLMNKSCGGLLLRIRTFCLP